MNASPRSLVVALTLVALLVFSPTWLYGQSSVSVERIDNGLQVKFGDEVFTNFLYMDYDKPILYPIFAPGSVAITRSFPMDESVSGDAHDHPHHKSFWLAHGDVNGFDFWSEKAAIHCFQVDLQDDGFVAHNEWMGQGKILVTETSEYKFEDKGECRLITVDTKLECGEDVDEAVFGDTKEGFFALRTHPNLRLTNSPGNGVTTANGQALNSNGDKNRDLWGKAAKWVYYWGDIDSTTLGIAILDHPDNLRHPTTWHARDYGLVAANPFGLHDFLKRPKGEGKYVLKKDEPIQFRYQVVVTRGQLNAEELEELFADFAKQ